MRPPHRNWVGRMGVEGVAQFNARVSDLGLTPEVMVEDLIERGITERAIAKHLKITTQAVSKWRWGGRVKPENLEKLAAFHRTMTEGEVKRAVSP